MLLCAKILMYILYFMILINSMDKLDYNTLLKKYNNIVAAYASTLLFLAQDCPPHEYICPKTESPKYECVKCWEEFLRDEY